MKKAKFLYTYYDKKVGKVNVYEYRGYEYEIAFNTEELPAYLHKYEQNKIDTRIEDNEKHKVYLNKIDALPQEERKKYFADYGFELWWKYLEEEN